MTQFEKCQIVHTSLNQSMMWFFMVYSKNTTTKPAVKNYTEVLPPQHPGISSIINVFNKMAGCNIIPCIASLFTPNLYIFVLGSQVSYYTFGQEARKFLRSE